MTRQCPFCEAAISDEQLASVPMPVCPECNSSLPVEFWSSDVRGSAASPIELTPIEDEITVDFPTEVLDSTSADHREEISELSADWFDDVALEAEPEGADDLATVLPSHLRNEFNLIEGDESAEKLFELEPTDGGDGELAGASPHEDYALSMEPMVTSQEPSKSAVATMDDASRHGDVAGAAVQPFEMKNGFGADSEPPKTKKGILASLRNAVLMAVGLIGTLCLLQLLCWWILRFDPFQVALMLPKSVAWLSPYSLTEDGQRDAMQTKIRPTTTGEELTDDDLKEHGWSPDDAEAQVDDVAVAQDEPDAATEDLGADVPLESSESTPGMDDLALAPSPVEPESAGNLDADASVLTENDGDGEFSESSPAPGDSEATDSPPELLDQYADDNSDSGTTLPDADPATAEEPSESDSMDDLLSDLDAIADDADTTDSQASELDVAEYQPPPPAPVITNVPVYQVADLRRALASAERATNELNDAKRQQVDAAKLTQTARDFYTSICQLAETATLADGSVGTGELTGVRTLLANLAQDAKKMRMIGTTASGWISRKLGNGVVVAGTIESVHPVGRFQEVTLLPIGSDQTMTIVTSEPDPATQDLLSAGRNVLLAGFVVRDPESQLPSFLSSEPTVVWLHNVIVEVP